MNELESDHIVLLLISENQRNISSHETTGQRFECVICFKKSKLLILTGRYISLLQMSTNLIAVKYKPFCATITAPLAVSEKNLHVKIA